jgi:hypothetical protein
MAQRAAPRLFALFCVVFAAFVPPAAAAQARCQLDDQKMQQTQKKIDKARAFAKAEASEKFNIKTKGHAVESKSMYFIWSFDPGTCENLVMSSVNVVHLLADKKTGKHVKNAVAHLNPSTLEVEDVSEHVVRFNASYRKQSANWSGYTTELLQKGNTKILNGAQASWNVPELHSPEYADPFCYSTVCELATWISLQADRVGTQMAQGGVLSVRDCDLYRSGSSPDNWEITYRCSNTHHLFYEFYPASAVGCVSSHHSTKAGDEIYAGMLQSSGYYNIQVSNQTDGYVCKSEGQYSYAAKASSFILELPETAGEIITLPAFFAVEMSDATVIAWTGKEFRKFGLDTIVNSMAPNNEANAITTIMGSAQSPNVVPSNVTSGGEFLHVYMSSAGTGLVPVQE